MLVNSVYIISGLVLLVLGAEGLVRGGTGLALRLGVTALVIGLTVVAWGTGSPEFVLSIEAARAGSSGLALGNVLGSNISNVALVLGLAAIVRPMSARSEIIRREVPVMIAVTLMLCALLLDGRLSRIEGLVMVIGAVIYTVSSYLVAKRGEGRVVDAEFDDALIEEPARPLWLDGVLLGGGLVALLVGASLLLKGATFVATALGMSEVVIGLTVVAVGTSLPELATSVTAALRGEADVAFGNVIGSNIFNILAVLGVAALIHPFEVQGLRTLDLVALAGSAVLLLPLLWRGSVLNRWEGGVLVAGYVAYIYSLLV